MSQHSLHTLQACPSELAAAQAGVGGDAPAPYLPSEYQHDLDLGRGAGGRPVSPVPLNHYLQNMISPRSRSEYDEFNRFHFSQLRQAGRMDKRKVTPKVGGGELVGLLWWWRGGG
jgi:hypothetical protein